MSNVPYDDVSHIHIPAPDPELVARQAEQMHAVLTEWRRRAADPAQRAEITRALGIIIHDLHELKNGVQG